MTLFLAPIQITKRNGLTCFYRVLKLPEVSDLSILRSNGMIRLRQPPDDASASLGDPF